MKLASVTIKYDEDKLNAIKQYMEKKDADFDGEMGEVMNKLWDKYVPQPVREYIESRNPSPAPARNPGRATGNVGANASRNTGNNGTSRPAGVTSMGRVETE